MESFKPILSPRELAEAIGVSESSIKRWADDGAVDAVRTAGGHRRIPIAEAIRFVRASGLELVRPEILGLSRAMAPTSPPDPGADPAIQLFNFLHAGDADQAQGLLVALYLKGKSLAQVIDGALQGAMEKMGEQWLASPAGVFWEHRATAIMLQALHQLRALLAQPRSGAPRALGGAPPQDPYILPSLCVAVVLSSLGLHTTNLGPETPIRTLRRAITDLEPRIVWLSISAKDRPRELRAEIRGLLDELKGRRATLLVGGRMRDHLDLGPHPNLHVGASMAELEAYAKGLVASQS